MDEAFVRLLCPSCRKDWETSQRQLPAPENHFHCPECGDGRRLAEFARTEHDLQAMKSLA